MPRHLRLRLLVFLALAIVLIVAVRLLLPGRPPQVQVPNPNGYDDFIKAGKLVTPAPTNLSVLSDAALERFVEQNSEALRLIRSGLSKDSKVPLRYEQGYLEGRFAELGNLKRSAWMLVAIGQWHERQQRTNEAAQIYADTVRYAHQSFRGGLIIDLLVSVAIEAIASKPLRKLTPSLDASACRELIAKLMEVDAEAESFEQIIAQERSFFKAERGVAYYGQWLAWALSTRSLNPTKQITGSARQKYEGQRWQRYQLLAELAARAYELEQGQAPKSFDGLSPTYIKIIPAEFRATTNSVYQFN